MYNYLSNIFDNIPSAIPDKTLPWLEALTDAKERHDQAAAKDKHGWLMVMGTIRQAIERGEPWPEEEKDRREGQ